MSFPYVNRELEIRIIPIIGPLWTYRGFILGSVKREFESRYQNSVLGALWNILNPLAMILIYTLVFSAVMRARLPGFHKPFAYSVHLCAGIFSWNLFVEIVGRATNIFLEQSNLLKKVNFPRLCLPAVVVTNALVNFFILFSLFTAFLIVTGSFPGWIFLGLFPLVLIEVMFSIGLGVTLGVLNVFFRDVGLLIGIVLQFWFWLTPIVYPVSILSTSLQSMIQFNPMAGLISGYQSILVSGQFPPWQSLIPVTTLSVVFLVSGFYLFRRRAGEMVDEL